MKTIGKSHLALRVEKIERRLNLEGQCFCMVSDGGSGFLPYTYWILTPDEIQPKDRPYLHGPFHGVREAREWSLVHLRTNHPDTYEALLKSRSIESIMTDMWLTVQSAEWQERLKVEADRQRKERDVEHGV